MRTITQLVHRIQSDQYEFANMMGCGWRAHADCMDVKMWSMMGTRGPDFSLIQHLIYQCYVLQVFDLVGRIGCLHMNFLYVNDNAGINDFRLSAADFLSVTSHYSSSISFIAL